MDIKFNMSDEEFERVMKAIDDELVSEGIKIPARQIRGWMLFCKKQGLQGISFTDPVSSKVMDWFKDRYGERINPDFSLGHSVELVHGDLLRSRCSVFYGRIHVVCHPALLGRSTQGPAVNSAALVNVLDRVEGMTAPFAASLTPNQRQTLWRGFVASQIQLSRVRDVDGQTFVPEACADLREAVEHLFRNEPQSGLSKWASLQAAEKFLKAYIKQQGTEPERTHLLWKLAGTAESLGLRSIPKKILAQAECSPQMRYAGSRVSRAASVESYRAAVEIAGRVAVQLKAKSVWRTGLFAEGHLKVDGIPENIPMIAIHRVAPKAPWPENTLSSNS